MQVSDNQVEFIRNDLRNRGVNLKSLLNNLVDHICCCIEVHPGSDFNIVYNEVICAFGEHSFLKIQQDTILLLTIKKDQNMKKTMYVIGFIATFLTTTGLLFQFLHWKGASMILILAVLLINIGFLPMYFYDKYKKSISE